MVSVRQLLDVPGLDLHERHVADPLAPVRWVATSELADPTPFLEGGEVLLTTGLATAGWAAEWEEYVARLAAAGVVAVGLGVGLTHATSPDRLVAACRAHGVTLAEVPGATTFVAVSRAAATLLEAEDQASARRVLEVQRDLVQAAAADEPAALLDRLGRTVAMACLTDASGEPEVGPVGARPDLYDRTVVATEIGRMRDAGLRAAASVGTPHGTLLVHPLGVRGRPSTYLVTGLDPTDGPPVEVQRSAVTSAVALLSLGAERRRAGRETDRRLRARALELLVEGDDRSAVLLLRSTAGPQARIPARPVVVRAAGPRDRLDQAVDLLDARPVVCGVLDGEVVALLRARDARAVADDLAGLGLRVGLGEQAPIAEAARGHRTAGYALDRATDGVVVDWNATVGGGAAALIDPRQAAAFRAAYLGPVVEVGEESDTLLETLAVFLQHHGSQHRVAESLGVHRNTVRARIRRIEGLDRALAGRSADAGGRLGGAPRRPRPRPCPAAAAATGPRPGKPRG